MAKRTLEDLQKQYNASATMKRPGMPMMRGPGGRGPGGPGGRGMPVVKPKGDSKKNHRKTLFLYRRVQVSADCRIYLPDNLGNFGRGCIISAPLYT